MGTREMDTLVANSIVGLLDWKANVGMASVIGIHAFARGKVPRVVNRCVRRPYSE